MRRSRSTALALLCLLATAAAPAAAEWQPAKDEDGVRVWLRQDPGQPMKRFRGETLVQATPDQIVARFVGVTGAKDWMHSVSKSEKLGGDDREYTYYSVFDSPWPVADRLFVMRVRVERNADGSATLRHRPALDLSPELDAGVRVVEAEFDWTLEPQEGGTLVTYEGYVDPAGRIPNWLKNSTVVDSPFNSLRNLRGLEF